MAYIPYPNVVLLVFDTHRADALSCYADDAVETSNIDRIVESGTLFENAFSAGGGRHPHTGRCSPDGGRQRRVFQRSMPWMDEDIPLLADRLRDAGYDTYGVAGPSKMASPTGLDRGFNWYYEPWDHIAERPSAEWFQQLLTDEFVRRDAFRLLTRGSDYYNEIRIEKLLDALNGANNPFFGMVNLTTVHAPYDPPRPYKIEQTPSLTRPPLHVFEELFTPGRIDDDSVRDDRVFAAADGADSINIRYRYYEDSSYLTDEELGIVEDWYHASVRFLDDQVSRILRWFDERNLTDDTVFVLTADHGELFGEHGLLYHGTGLYDELLRVPLVFSGRGVPTEARRSDLVSLADVFTTVCSLVGAEIPKTDGINLFGPDRRNHVVAERAYTEHDNPEAESEMSKKTLDWMRVGQKSIRTEEYRFELRSDGTSSVYRVPSQEEVSDPDPNVVSDLRDRLLEAVGDEFDSGYGEEPSTATPFSGIFGIWATSNNDGTGGFLIGITVCPNMRTLLVGLDAACGPVLNPLFEEDALPNLEGVFKDGATGPLRSQIPPWTASAWPSLYTGKNPGKHGVFDFLAFDGYDWDIVNGTDVKARTMWDYLDERDLSSVVVNAPVTDPPRDVEGAVIPGYLAPDEPHCHPTGILDDVREAVGDYRVYAERETDDRVNDKAKFDEYVRLTHLRGETFRYLADRFDPDFGFVQFQKTDAVFHDFPGDEKKVRAVYEAVDEEVGETLSACDPDVVVVASDHGIGKYTGYEARVNEHLRREGLAETTTDGRGVPSWFQMKDERLVSGDDDGGRRDRTTLERLAALAAKGGLTYQRGKAVLDRVGLAEFVGRRIPIGAVFAASESVSFEKSRAYLRSASELGVRLNVEGRDPAGRVGADEYDAVRENVISVLEALVDPEGRQVFDEVVPREEYIHGPYADEAVDVLCVPRAFENSLSVHVGDPFGPPEPWNHKPDGVVAVAGEGVDAGADLSGAHLFDVAPTVLSTLDVAPDAEMDGETLAAVEAVEPVSYRAFETTDRCRTDDEAVENRLADLGYLG